jgi:hypothetical protein
VVGWVVSNLPTNLLTDQPHPLKSPSVYWTQLLLRGDDSLDFYFLSVIDCFLYKQPQQSLPALKIKSVDARVHLLSHIPDLLFLFSVQYLPGELPFKFSNSGFQFALFVVYGAHLIPHHGIPIEAWIGKDDHLIRQISQRSETAATISTYTTRYYDYNADITIKPPLDDSGGLLPGWKVASIESTTSLIPVYEAIAALTGDEDWSDPDVVREIFDMMGRVRDPWAYFYALPSQAQDALIDFITNSLQTDVVTVTTVISIGYNDNDGVFNYSNSGTGLDVIINTGEVSVEGEGVTVETAEIVELWVNAILAPDPQAYFDALSEETRRDMVGALSDNSIFALIRHALD